MHKIGYVVAFSFAAGVGSVAPASAFPVHQDASCGGLLDTLSIVRPEQIRAIGDQNHISVMPLCEGFNLQSFGNAGGLRSAIAANPLLVMALNRGGYQPDEVVGVLFAAGGSVILYVHQEGGRRRVPLLISDARLKTDIRLVETLPNRLKLYSFRYLDSTEVFTGVMAQDLLKSVRFRSAAVRLSSGYYAVDYDALGLTRLVDDAMRIEGSKALEFRLREAA